MSRPPHLLVVVSPHGFGHFAQTAPVLRRLHRLLPELRLTLMTRLPAALLRQRLPIPFTHLPRAADFGMVMRSSIDVDVAASHRAYRRLHRRWSARVADFAELLQRLAPRCVLSNVAYLPLAAAGRLGVPAFALCSLNWADIYQAYCGHLPGAETVLAQMRAAYAQARCFLRPQPAMPMADLPCRGAIGPIATLGRRRRDALAQRLGVAPGERMLLVAPGGIPTALDLSRWPALPGWHLLVPAAWRPQGPRRHAIEALDWPFADLLASVDVLLTKPGYGSFVEAACQGIPVLYVARGDWPEEPGLTAWMRRHGRALELSRAAFYAGRLAAPLAQLLAQPAPPPPVADGDWAAARLLAGALRGA